MDRITAEWNTVRPDVNVAPLGVVGRVSRLSRLIDRHLSKNFARYGLENWTYDVLATLRRSGPPFELTAGQLRERSMVTNGAITNRVDRLAQRGACREGTDTGPPQGAGSSLQSLDWRS